MDLCGLRHYAGLVLGAIVGILVFLGVVEIRYQCGSNPPRVVGDRVAVPQRTDMTGRIVNERGEPIPWLGTICPDSPAAGTTTAYGDGWKLFSATVTSMYEDEMWEEVERDGDGWKPTGKVYRRLFQDRKK